MLPKEALYNEIEQLPDDIAYEILDFVQFLKEKHYKMQLDNTILSESSLKKDWLLTEEDEAWISTSKPWGSAPSPRR